ncbi:hypothetical protein J437_LFUL014890 [Ladona fulva]|uniref:PIH1D1/2/3 CS-like domain-containing protein n=1 Tax=Ladona fulva TaxID=123851 RepID=A0A8K0K306_LADFU|nr:hypothetical protein J437_LFUL014890 [Ladona fulva]
MNFENIKLLEKLLKTGSDHSDSDDDLPSTGQSRIGPGHIGPRKKPTADEQVPSKDPNEIWDKEQIDETGYLDEVSDPRKVPEYDIKFRQAVTSEDLYLQIGGKTPASFSCEDLVLTVCLKGETRNKIDLNVQTNRIDLRSPLYRLGLPLPHHVDPNSSKATWDQNEETLTIILRIVREFDFLNF